ncbi:hypothetical protein PC129_g23953 [Phytophthora cactorum]|uniref:Uncharacterized protein n=1 Tax=Phytophthora cactorum TaxID=29920 RepID=A0A8T1BDQ2_9STRA|nr:hypothetical protein PC112_g20302 [Phytophthora cactorum]KAG2880138.1 hypothetical protein PC114_g22229 [Phytophthora cactorum]KAG2889346.1 hypothetical protein PC115_g19786 [Phytophthora cactorum]KAG2899299.1 hypothetical protein PC117_g22291 [Phytophthora cactorum]KAG2965038.1 hypothetical protein PC118_g19978 [Phytophthora cactorum]
MARRGRRSGVNQLLERGNAVTKLHDQRSKFHLDVRRSLSGLRDGGYTIAQSARVTVNLGLTVRGVLFRPRRHHCAMRAARLAG